MRGKQNKMLLSLVCCGILVCSTGFSQAAHADSDWFSMVVNPLLKEVVAPALKTSMNNWKAKRQQKKAQQQDSSMYELQVDAAAEIDTTVEADASSDMQETASGWRLPEEPVH